MKSIAGGWDNGFMLSNSIADGNRPYSSRSVISFGIYFTVKHLLNLVKGYAEFMNMLKLSSLMRLFAKNCWRSKAKRWGFDLALPSQTLIELVIKLIVWWTFKTVYSIKCNTFMAIKSPLIKLCEQWLCCGIFIPIAKRFNVTVSLLDRRLETSMAFLTITTGSVIFWLLLPSMAEVSVDFLNTN